MTKKKYQIGLKWILAMVLCLILVIGATSVGCKSKPEPEPAPTPTPTPAPAPLFASQEDFNELVTRLDTFEINFQKLEDEIDDLQRDIDDIDTSSDSVSQSSFNSLQTTVNNRLAELEADNATLKSAVTVLREDMEADTSNSGSSSNDLDPEDAVETETRYFPLYNVKAGTTSISIPIRIKTENTLTINIDEVEFGIEVRISDDDLDIDKIVMSGGGATWSGYGSGGTWSFVNWTDIDYDAGERKTFDPVLKITLGTAVVADTDFTASIETYCDDYRVKD